MADRERAIKQLTDRLQGLLTALQVQRTLASEELRQVEQKCTTGNGKKMKYYGYREVTVRFLGGLEIKLWARY